MGLTLTQAPVNFDHDRSNDGFYKVSLQELVFLTIKQQPEDDIARPSVSHFKGVSHTPGFLIITYLCTSNSCGSLLDD